jgi:hypothetical protein
MTGFALALIGMKSPAVSSHGVAQSSWCIKRDTKPMLASPFCQANIFFLKSRNLGLKTARETPSVAEE